MRVRILVYFLVVILLSISAYSFGISHESMDDDTIELYPGQEYMFELRIQNKEDKSRRVEVSLDTSIATLVGEPLIEVPGRAGDKGEDTDGSDGRISAFFEIMVPEDAKPGDIFNINYVVASADSEGSPASDDVRYDRSFKVKVIPKPENSWVEESLDKENEEGSLITGNVLISLSKVPVWASLPLVVLLMAVLVAVIWKNSTYASGSSVGKNEWVLDVPPEQHKQDVNEANRLEQSKEPEAGIKEPKEPEEEEQQETIHEIVHEEIHEDNESIEHPPESPDNDSSEDNIPNPQPPPVEKSVEHQEEYKIEPCKVEPSKEDICKEKNELSESSIASIASSADFLFHLKDGRKLRDVEDLYHVLMNMSQETFDHHVSPDKNDFASWIGDSMGDSELAGQLFMVKSRQDLFSMIEESLGRTAW